MANQGAGYGGGGAGGGEYADGRFTSPSAGKGGYAACIEVRGLTQPYLRRLLVKNNNVDYPIFHITAQSAVGNGSSNYGYNSTSVSKLTLTVPKIITSRTYKTSPLSIKSNNTLEYGEVSSSASLNSGYKVVTSKIQQSGGSNLGLLINTNITSYSGDYEFETYPGQIRTSSQTTGGGTLSGSIDPGCICYFILQAGGGGGGGGDDSYGLFNYASGGGGGGGGGACVVKYANTTDYDRLWTISVGSGGSAGRNANSGGLLNGSDGGATTLKIYAGTSTTESNLIGTVTAGGGGRGYCSSGNSDPGSGGSRGQLSSSGSGFSVIRIVDGGTGGKTGSGGAVATSGSSSDIGSFDICNSTLSIDTSTGSGGGTGSWDDRGGGGGASWLGSGGYY